MYAVKSATEFRLLGYFDEPVDGEALITIEEFLARIKDDGSLDLELAYP